MPACLPSPPGARGSGRGFFCPFVKKAVPPRFPILSPGGTVYWGKTEAPSGGPGKRKRGGFMQEWYQRSPAQVLSDLDTHSARGLTHAQARQRLEKWGPNKLEEAPPPSPIRRFLQQLKDPMVLVLLGAAGLSLAASRGEDWVDALIILVIVVVNAAVSLTQEAGARRALEALRRMSAPRARVVREGTELQVEAAVLVPGDIVHLEAGDLVPADCRLLESAGLKADESAITGESAPVEKEAGAVFPGDTPLGDRRNMVMASTVITAGRGVAVVTATGMETQVGRIAGMLLTHQEKQTPLQRNMGEVSRNLSFLCLCVCALTFGLGLIQGKELLAMFLTAVSLAVAAIPEGLPAIVTIVLALGVGRMARRGAIVKTLPAVETLGCAGVICSDKTGTLTQNKMTVTQVWSLGGRHRGAVLAIGCLCADARLRPGEGGGPLAEGDPTECALVVQAALEGLDKNRLEEDMPRRGEVPFDSGRKLMTTVHALPGGGYRIMTKGAPDVLLARCTRILDRGEVPLTGGRRAAVLRANDAMAGRALRVLGCAFRDVASLPRPLTAEEVERELTFAGLVGMMDPPRPQARRAVERCHTAGIRPVMITGDHRLTALAIARELDIFRPGDRAVTGEDLDFMPQALLEEDVDRFTVYARVSPEHKSRIVRAWQKRGAVVAMTGDGVNDAPALKAADIGCAMGRSGTEVAKGAADMILTDDNFSTILQAVEEGRGIYANIRKAIHYLLSCNMGEIFTIFAATLLGFAHTPLAAVQLLWLNLVTDSLPALALGMEPVEAGVMEEPPRKAGEALFTPRFSLRLVWQGVLVGLVTLGAYRLGLEAGHAAASTMAFATLTFSQLFHAFDVRGERRTLAEMGVLTNPAMNKAFLMGLVLQGSVLLLPPLQSLFQVVPMTPGQWGAVAGLSLVPLAVCETVKALTPRRGEEEAD